MEITDQTRAGIASTSKTEYDFNINGKARFPNLPNVEYDLPISAQVSPTTNHVKRGTRR
jgi:long-chain fatty acid transport protein